MLLHPSRKQRYLSRLSDKPKKKFYIIFDVESDVTRDAFKEEIHKPKLICASTLTLHSDGTHEKGKEMIFWRVSDFHFWVSKLFFQFRHINLIAHNTSYDMITSRILELVEILNLICIAWNPKHGSFYCRFSNRLGSFTFVDNLNFFTSSLSQVAKELGMEKLEMPSGTGVNWAWIEYCMMDVRIVVKSMLTLSEFASQWMLGELPITRASLAMSIWRKAYHKTNVLTTTDRQALTLEYNSYYGGRTEMFQYGKLPSANYYYFDINSLYPSVMQENIFSTKLRAYFKKIDLERLERYSEQFGVIAKVKIKTEEPLFPKRIENFTAFPIGEYWTYLSTPEILKGLELGVITSVKETSVYHQQKLFADFITNFHALKQRYTQYDKPAFRYFTKLILNSLYGKFGQKASRLEDLGIRDEKMYDMFEYLDPEKGELETHKVINHKRYREFQDVVSVNSVPSVASEVTSYARIKMLDIFRKVGWQNVLYTDTDSIITNSAGKRIIEKYYEGAELGNLLLEKKSRRVELRALKDYTFGADTHIKGVKRGAKRLKEGVYESVHFNTVIESMQKPTKDKMRTRRVTKVLTREYRKGTKESNGKIKPLELSE